MQPNRRTARVRELLKHEVAECIRRELSIDEVGLLTVNDVGLASDLRSATVFVGFVGTPDQKKRAKSRLADHARRIQMIVGTSIQLKFVPELRFQLDDSIEQGHRIVALLEELDRPKTATPTPPGTSPTLPDSDAAASP